MEAAIASAEARRAELIGAIALQTVETETRR
jgi:hypothetical protein